MTCTIKECEKASAGAEWNGLCIDHAIAYEEAKLKRCPNCGAEAISQDVKHSARGDDRIVLACVNAHEWRFI